MHIYAIKMLLSRSENIDNTYNEYCRIEKQGMTTLKNGYVLDGMNEFERNMKRIFDFCWAAVCLVVFSPLFLICYIAIKRETAERPSSVRKGLAASVVRSTSISSEA